MKRLLGLLLLIGCATAPTPAPTPAPAATTAPAAVPANEPVTRYTITGTFESENECGSILPSAIEMTVHLTNGAHTMTAGPKRVGLMGRSYYFTLDWPNSWGTPAEWSDWKIVRFDQTPLCMGSCASGQCSNATDLTTIPVTGSTTERKIVLRCVCAK